MRRKNNYVLALIMFVLLGASLTQQNLMASEVSKEVTAQQINYAPTNPSSADITSAAPTDIVTIPDTNLAQAIAAQLSLPVDGITVADMAGLDNISYQNKGIVNLSGLEYATNLKFVDLSSNQIVDISPLSNHTEIQNLNLANNQVVNVSTLGSLTKLRSLDLSNNQIVDISAVTGLSNLFMLTLTGNHIVDISPVYGLLQAGTLAFASAGSQTINLDADAVKTADEIFSSVIDFQGNAVQVSLGVPVIGINNLSGPFSVTDSDHGVTFSGTINQEITYQEMDRVIDGTANEGEPLSDEQLIALFEIVSNDNLPITVDQSLVDYDTPGTYQIVFSDGVDSANTTLEIIDVLPTISAATTELSIEQGSSIDDLIKAYGVTATEFAKGDLTDSIVADDSAVNYNTPGSYKIKFTVSDQEGNEEMVTTNLVITEKETPSEVNSEVVSETESEVTSETVSEENSEVNPPKEETSNQTLATTGQKIMIIAIGLIAVIIVLIVIKKAINKK